MDEKGIIEIGGYGQHFVGTWDGSALIVRGQSGSRLSGPEPQPAPEDAADQPAPPASDQAS